RSSFFSSNAPPTTHFYTLSLHDALPISLSDAPRAAGRDPGRLLPVATRSSARPPPLQDRNRGLSPDPGRPRRRVACPGGGRSRRDRKSTRLNSSHVAISYAVFCLKKKTK